MELVGAGYFKKSSNKNCIFITCITSNYVFIPVLINL
jgi:hypothetical protein